MGKFLKCLVSIILLLCFDTALAQPHFAIETVSGVFNVYNLNTISDTYIDANITQSGNIWTLNLTAKVPIKSVKFPFDDLRQPLDNDIADDIYYYPYISGLAEKATNRNTDWTWWGLQYPGNIFSPVIIIADANNGRIEAAVNWPVKHVTPYYAAERMMFDYSFDTLQVNEVENYSVLIDSVIANPALGQKPWQMAMDKYRTWLNSKVPLVVHPPQLQNVHGWLQTGLMNQPTFDLNGINSLWQQWRDKLGWIQFWGQMSNYAGPAIYANPPLLPGEVVDCCALNYNIHNRYLPDVVNFMRDSVVGLGYLGGYYSAGYYGLPSDPKRLLDTEAGKDWLLNWITKNNIDYFANSFYLDVVCRTYFGDGNIVRNLFDGIQIPAQSVTEGIVDIIPSAGLISGCLTGQNPPIGGPGLTPENSNITMFTQLGRYLLNDHAVFLGSANGDHVFWGPTNNYWTERQAFVLGAKYDVGFANDNYNADTPNPALLLGITERTNFNWWPRNPKYLDTKDVTNISPGIDVRRFIDNNNCNLFAIDNWNQLIGQSFSFNGQTYTVSSQRLSIIDGCNVTDVEDDKFVNEIIFYPNPSSGVFTIKSNETILSYDITDNLGQLVHTGTSSLCDISMLANGVYFIKIKLNNEIVTKKILKFK